MNKSEEKYQDKNEFIIHNDLSDVIWNQIINIIEETDPLIMVKLSDVTWIHCAHYL